MTYESQIKRVLMTDKNDPAGNRSGTCCVLIGCGAWRETQIDAKRAKSEKYGDLAVNWTGSTSFAVPHSHLAQLVDLFEPIAALEAPGLLKEFAPELAALRGDQTALQGFALTASERRLSRESEFNFRILSNGVRFIERCLMTLPEFAGTTLVVCVPDLDCVDRLSLLAVDQFRRRAQSGAPIEVLCGLSASAFAVSQNVTYGQDPLDVDAERARFLKGFLETTGLEQISGPPGGASESDGLATVSKVLPTLPDEVPELLKAIDLGQFDIVLHSLTQSSLPEAERVRLLGLTHAYLGNFNLALTLYRRLRDLAETPIERARATVYVALLLNKRLNKLGEARELLEVSLKELTQDESPAARLEKGWLRNGLALVLFRSGDNQDAFECCRKGLAEVARVHGSDAMHLKVNIINNLSALCETQRDIAGAKKIWERFEQLSAAGESLFRKVYLYRAAGLTHRAGALQTARDTMLTCWREADLLGDIFHQAYIAYDLGVMSLELGMDRAAKSWFERAKEAALQGIDDDAAAHAQAALDAISSVGGSSDATALGLKVHGTKLGRTFHLIHVPPLGGVSQ